MLNKKEAIIEQYINGISSTIKDGDIETILKQEVQEDGRIHIIFEKYKKNKVVESIEYIIEN